MDLNALHSFAKDLATKAGKIIVEERSQLSRDYKRDGLELVTSADLKSDELIRESIQKRYPGHAILSEESSPSLQNLSKGPLWIIDPIDGTVNYSYGHDQCAICIAFAMDGVVQTSVVHVPFAEETFSAIRGEGAWLNGARIRASDTSDLKRSLIATGFPYDKSKAIDSILKRLKAVLLNCRDIRRVGSAAIDICWVAMGRLDGYYETVHPWDVAAAGLIAREAGARTGHWVDVPKSIPSDLFSEGVIVAAPGVYEKLREILV